jgi:hypothetical protein
VYADLEGHIAQGYAVESVLGEEKFRRVENLFQRFGTLLGLGSGHLFGRVFPWGLRLGSRHRFGLYCVSWSLQAAGQTV